MGSEEAINEYYTLLEDLLPDAPCDVIYHVDEWVDARKCAVVVPADYPAQNIPIPVSRVDSRASIIACISASGRDPAQKC
jgi:hypothetical protein